MKIWYSYYKSMLFKRGKTMDISPTYNCNMSCGYCVAQIGSKGFPCVPEKSIDEWKVFIQNFPHRIKQIQISGGEPTLVPWIAEFINWLLDRGHHVTLITNLCDWEEILKVKPSRRFKIVSAFHLQDRISRFDEAYQALYPIYQIEVKEFKRLPYSESWHMITSLDDPELHIDGYWVSPDFRMYGCCAEHIKDMGKRK